MSHFDFDSLGVYFELNKLRELIAPNAGLKYTEIVGDWSSASDCAWSSYCVSIDPLLVWGRGQWARSLFEYLFIQSNCKSL